MKFIAIRRAPSSGHGFRIRSSMSASDLLGIGDFDYHSRVVDEAALIAAKDESPFHAESFSLLGELLQSTKLVASIQYLNDTGQPRALTRDEAIVAGLMMRCAKLHELLLEPLTRSRMELFALVWRPAIESAVNSIFLVQHGTPAVFDAYVGYSLRTEKQLLERVRADVEQQGSPPSPIQERMLHNFPRAFEFAGISPDTVDVKDRSDWSGPGGIYRRFTAIGWKDLYPLFQIGSHYVHGNWHDLTVHHVATDADGFHITPEFTPVRCQPVLAAVKILASAAHVYIATKTAPSEDRAVIEDRIGFCGAKAEIIERLHEDFLHRIAGQEGPLNDGL